jgi:hypothetical protein
MEAKRGVHDLQNQASLLGDQPTAMCGYGAGWRKVCRDRTLLRGSEAQVPDKAARAEWPIGPIRRSRGASRGAAELLFL